jgi:hypothetical protein
MAMTLVHESCHIKQAKEGISYSDPNDYERECMMAGGDDFYEKLGAPQWLIDWNERNKDKLRGTND